MGIYLDSKEDIDGSKRCILAAIPSLKEITHFIKPDKGDVYLCLVNNGAFSALGVAYDKREQEAFSNLQDRRPKKFFEAKLEDIKPFLNPRDWKKLTEK